MNEGLASIAGGPFFISGLAPALESCGASAQLA